MSLKVSGTLLKKILNIFNIVDIERVLFPIWKHIYKENFRTHSEDGFNQDLSMKTLG